MIAQPAVAILDCAREHAVDLIAMATHGRGGIARMVLGSVADKVLRGAGAPLLLHRPYALPPQISVVDPELEYADFDIED
jgi:hypothetical protein